MNSRSSPAMYERLRTKSVESVKNNKIWWMTFISSVMICDCSFMERPHKSRAFVAPLRWPIIDLSSHFDVPVHAICGSGYCSLFRFRFRRWGRWVVIDELPAHCASRTSVVASASGLLEVDCWSILEPLCAAERVMVCLLIPKRHEKCLLLCLWALIIFDLLVRHGCLLSSRVILSI